MKLLILGNGGAGKSHLAKLLAKILKCDSLHLDSLYWKNNWIHIPLEQWEASLFEHLKKETWVMEGTPMRDLALRVSHADLVILLDTSRYICILRIILKGILKSFGISKHRTDGCPVQGLSLRTIQWVWNYPWRIKPAILSCLMENKSNQDIVYLRNKKQIAHFIQNFKGKVCK